MMIKVKLLNGQYKEIEVEPTDKVIDLKQKLEELQGIPPEQQRLIFSGRQLLDDNTLAFHKVGPGAQINFLLSLRGGY